MKFWFISFSQAGRLERMPTAEHSQAPETNFAADDD
jgi:hypothetical protein